MTHAPYAPRRVVPLAPWTLGALRLKPYTIAPDGADAVPAPRLAAARDAIAAALPAAAAAEGESAGVGFAVIHQGTLGTWALGDWWAHGDILCQRLWHADPGSEAFRPMDHRPLTACVWELAVIAHERRAFIDTMLTARPDPAAYLGRTLAPGLH